MPQEQVQWVLTLKRLHQLLVLPPEGGHGASLRGVVG